jgi:hypothetical protein
MQSNGESFVAADVESLFRVQDEDACLARRTPARCLRDACEMYTCEMYACEVHACAREMKCWKRSGRSSITVPECHHTAVIAYLASSLV